MLLLNFLLAIIIYSVSRWNVECSTQQISTEPIGMENKPNYDIILSQESLNKFISYKNDLHTNQLQPGSYLRDIMTEKNVNLGRTSTEQFIELLLLTKKPLIFAESAIRGGGSDWNDAELQILGDLSIAMNVTIYDNGVWNSDDENFRVHDPPLNGTLLFTPGPLLRGPIKGMPPDLNEVTSGNDIDQEKYNRLIERRLMPLFYYANEMAKKDNQQALITLPGIGAGAFAGRYRGEMGQHLNQALQNILRKHAKNYNNIACIYFDPHRECTNETQQFENVKYRVRPAIQNNGKSQLCKPNEYEESGDDFSNCKLYKIVAWDHVSYPGNDYFVGSRNTDDGVSAAATNSMEVITGIKGTYDKWHYIPPNGNSDWEEVVHRNHIKLHANDNVKVVTTDGLLIDLKDIFLFLK